MSILETVCLLATASHFATRQASSVQKLEFNFRRAVEIIYLLLPSKRDIDWLSR